MGQNTPERKDCIMENLVATVGEQPRLRFRARDTFARLRAWPGLMLIGG
jgi:hypothetical protein